MEQFPLVSVVTPSFNMAAYLPETIDSVLNQDYPHIEYIVMDGGSTDGTVSLLERYAGRLRYSSEPDRGAANAINRGFQAARGSVLAWLSADDTLIPGAISAAVRHLKANPEAAVVYGRGCWMDEHGATIGPYPTVPFDAALLARECFVCQPAAFMRKKAVVDVGFLDESLEFSYDYDLWIRMSRLHKFLHIDEEWASSRMHSDNKSLGQRRRVLLENMYVLKRHYGYVPFPWTFAYSCHLLDGRDQFFQPLRPSFLKYALSIPLGCWFNRTRPLRYLAEWASKARPRQFLLYWNSRRGRRIETSAP